MTSRIHALADTDGLPIRRVDAEVRDNRHAGKRLSRLEAASMLLAGRGYGADCSRERAIKNGAWANIPPKSNRDSPACFSPYLYRARNPVEGFFDKIKPCRRIATRHGKLAANYLAFVHSGSIRWWLRINESSALAGLSH